MAVPRIACDDELAATEKPFGITLWGAAHFGAYTFLQYAFLSQDEDQDEMVMQNGELSGDNDIADFLGNGGTNGPCAGALADESPKSKIIQNVKM